MEKYVGPEPITKKIASALQKAREYAETIERENTKNKILNKIEEINFENEKDYDRSK